MYSVFINLILVSLFFVPSITRAEASIEAMCKVKAKEVAIETYKGCVTENKQAEISKIRTDYQHKLSELKEYYNKKLKKISGEKQISDDSNKTKSTPLASPTSSPSPSALKKQVPEKPTQGIAKKLPSKQQDNGPALTIDGENSDNVYQDKTPDDTQVDVVNPESAEE